MAQATERMKQFAEENRLRPIDTGAERVVPGKYGELADMDDEGLLRLRLLAVPRSANVDRTLRARRAKALAGGLTSKWQEMPRPSSISIRPMKRTCISPSNW